MSLSRSGKNQEPEIASLSLRPPDREQADAPRRDPDPIRAFPLHCGKKGLYLRMRRRLPSSKYMLFLG
ncbi:hypothetical protein ACLOJK_011661 [Asimina triloba]